MLPPSDQKLKHLEFIVGVVGRMSTHSATLKSFCLILVAGALGLAASTKSTTVLVYLIPIALIFAGLDSQYLNLERAFRRKYEEINTDTVATSDMSISPRGANFGGWLSSLFSWSVSGFYLAVIAVLAAVWYAGDTITTK